MPRLLLILIAIFATIALNSCGTKGPLYIPEQRYPQPTDAKPAEPSPAPAIQVPYKTPSEVKE